MITSVFSFSADLINTDPSPIVVGDYADITVRFSNDNGDNEKYDVSFGLDDSDYFYVIDGPNDKISKANPGEYFTRTFRVFFSNELNQGNIKLPFYVISNNIKETFDLDVFVKDTLVKPDIRVGSVKSTPNDLLPDTDNNKLTVTLQNLGDKNAELVSAKLISNSSDITESYSYSMTDSVVGINGGTQDNLEFTIDLLKDANGVIPAEIEMTYRFEKAIGNSYDIVTKKLPIEIRVSDSPRLEITNIELIDNFNIGSTDNRVMVTIKNVGLEDAEDVRVRLSPDISYPFVYDELTKYVTSKIKVGETATVQYKVEVLSDATARDYGVRANLESIVGDSRYTTEDNLKLTVQDKKANSDLPVGSIVIVIIVIVSGLFGFNTYRNSHKTKKNK